MQGREGAGPGISQPRSDGGRRFHPGPHRGPGRECCTWRQEGTGMGDDESMADVALGCSVGSQEFPLKCHFSLGQAGELCKNQVQAEGKVPLDHPQPPGTTSGKICSHEGTMCRAFHPLGVYACMKHHVCGIPWDIWVCVWVYHACCRAGTFWPCSTILSAAPWGSVSPQWD